jgi:hypothetical protein
VSRTQQVCWLIRQYLRVRLSCITQLRQHGREAHNALAGAGSGQAQGTFRPHRKR